MLIVEWRPISRSEEIPPFGDELTAHILKYSPYGRYASCSAWRLLHDTLVLNGLEGGKVCFGKNGKPGFCSGGLFFSLSHSRDLCAAAVSDIPVGVDLEAYRGNISERLPERSLSTAERAAFDGDFIRLWCRKEAMAKLTGQGIGAHPDRMDTSGHSFFEQCIEYSGKRYWLAALAEKTVQG